MWGCALREFKPEVMKKFIAKWCVDNKVSYKQLALASGVKKATLYSFMSTDRAQGMNIRYVFALAESMKVSIDMLTGRELHYANADDRGRTTSDSC